MNRIMNLKTSQVDFDMGGDMINVRNYFQIMDNNVQNTTALKSRRGRFVDKMNRHRNGDFLSFCDAKEIHMERKIGDWMKLNETRESSFRFSVEGNFKNF